MPLLLTSFQIYIAIEKSWESMLDDMSKHFDNHPYFLGGQPCIGDFAMGGMMYAHLFRDPIPGKLDPAGKVVCSPWLKFEKGCFLCIYIVSKTACCATFTVDLDSYVFRIFDENQSPTGCCVD